MSYNINYPFLVAFIMLKGELFNYADKNKMMGTKYYRYMSRNKSENFIIYFMTILFESDRNIYPLELFYNKEYL